MIAVIATMPRPGVTIAIETTDCAKREKAGT